MDLSTAAAINALNEGKVIGVPTDTVYGLSSLCEYGSELYNIKKRDKSKKLITMLHSIEQINISDPILLNMMKDVWPGAVTLIFEYEGDMRSFRIPNESNLLKLLKLLKKPIYTTSANISGCDDVITREQFKQVFPNIGLLKEESINKKSTVPSTILIYKNGKFERIR